MASSYRGEPVDFVTFEVGVGRDQRADSRDARLSIWVKLFRRKF